MPNFTNSLYEICRCQDPDELLEIWKSDLPSAFRNTALVALAKNFPDIKTEIHQKLLKILAQNPTRMDVYKLIIDFELERKQKPLTMKKLRKKMKGYK